MMTRQEMFDYAVGKVLAQGGPSATPTNTGAQCLYRGPNGRACLVGHFITDGEYVSSMEGCVSMLFNEEHLGVEHWLSDHEDFLHSLQECHDVAASVYCGIRKGYRLATDAEFWPQFKGLARNFARSNRLNPSVLDRIDRLMDAVTAFSEGGAADVEQKSLVTA